LKQKLHILFLSGWYPSRVSPLNGDFIQRHAEAVSLLHDVSVLHIISDENNKQNIEISSEKINNVHTHIGYVKSTNNPITKGIRFYKTFKKLLKKIGYFDFVHLNTLFPFGIFALYLKWLYQKHFIVTEHWTGYHLPQVKNISKINALLSRIIGKNAKYLSPVSNDLKLSMELFGIKGNYKTVPNVVDTNIFKPNNHTSSTFKILHVSNMLDKHKNISGIIKTIKEFSKHTNNFEFTLIGKNSNQYKKLIDQEEVSNFTTLIDHIPHQEVIKQMQQASVFVLFSNYENLPCVILESFSCGTPVISTDVGGISEFFPNNFGYLIPKGDQEELLHKLITIYNSSYVYNKKELHNYAQSNFSKLKIAESFTNLYTS